jgi:hypothetical protein
LRYLGRQFVRFGHACCLLVLGNFQHDVFTLVSAMAYDFGDCAHKTHGEALLARACLQTSRAWASSGGGGAGQYRLCARPSLGARDIYAGSGEGRGGGSSGGVLLLLGGAVGRRLEEVVDVVVVRGRLGLGL